MSMPNRTVYLPEEIDAMSREYKLNLSQLTQQAIKSVLKKKKAESLSERVELFTDEVESVGFDWPDSVLENSREEAAER